MTVQEMITADANRLPGPSVESWLDTLLAIAVDPDHRGSPNAVRVLSEYKLGGILAEYRHAANRAPAEIVQETGKTNAGLVVLELPPNGTEAPGHEPASA